MLFCRVLNKTMTRGICQLCEPCHTTVPASSPMHPAHARMRELSFKSCAQRHNKKPSLRRVFCYDPGGISLRDWRSLGPECSQCFDNIARHSSNPTNYGHIKKKPPKGGVFFMTRVGFEPTTISLKGCCSTN